MIFTAAKGQDFHEKFTFKNDAGKPIPVPAGNWVLTLARGSFGQQFTGLSRELDTIYWTMTADEVGALPYSNMTFTLTFNGQAIASGVLRVR